MTTPTAGEVLTMSDPTLLIEEAIEILREQGRHVLADEVDSFRARLAAAESRAEVAESRLREYEDAPVVAFQYYDTIGRRHFTRLGETAEQIGYECQPLIIRPRGGKGE